MKYVKKPVVIEAIRWLKHGDHPAVLCSDTSAQIPHFFIETLEGEMMVSVCDYIIKGVKGEFYPCKPDIFELTYEAVK